MFSFVQARVFLFKELYMKPKFETHPALSLGHWISLVPEPSPNQPSLYRRLKESRTYVAGFTSTRNFVSH